MDYVSTNTASKIIRQALKSKMPKLSVRHGRGTAYGWIEISGSGQSGEFTAEEREFLKSVGLSPGGNFCNISPEDRMYWVNKLSGKPAEKKTEDINTIMGL